MRSPDWTDGAGSHLTPGERGMSFVESVSTHARVWWSAFRPTLIVLIDRVRRGPSIL